jgi:hypothetical protein
LTCCNDIHVDLACVGIGGRLLHGLLDQSDCLIQIDFLNFLRESHFGNGLCNSDHGLKLTRSGGDGLSGVTKTSHVHVLLDKVSLD